MYASATPLSPSFPIFPLWSKHLSKCILQTMKYETISTANIFVSPLVEEIHLLEPMRIHEWCVISLQERQVEGSAVKHTVMWKNLHGNHNKQISREWEKHILPQLKNNVLFNCTVLKLALQSYSLNKYNKKMMWSQGWIMLKHLTVCKEDDTLSCVELRFTSSSLMQNCL